MYRQIPVFDSVKLNKNQLQGGRGGGLTFVLSTPSTKARVLSVALTVVFKNPSTYTWYISIMPGGQSGGFQPTQTGFTTWHSLSISELRTNQKFSSSKLVCYSMILTLDQELADFGYPWIRIRLYSLDSCVILQNTIRCSNTFLPICCRDIHIVIYLSAAGI